MIDNLRTTLYPLGLLASVFFTLRFFLQWIGSEKKKESRVTRSFWHLSWIGNLILAIHAFIQTQFPLAVLQGVGAAIAWRNLELMRPNPRPLKTFLPKMIALPIVIAALFFLQPFEWMRPPTLPWTGKQAEHATFLWHFAGFLGMVLFSSRFWIQWWSAEKSNVSYLGKAFWWMSLLGSLLSLLYFIRLNDVVNIAGYGVGVIPYLRNLMLLKKTTPPLQKKKIFLFAGEQSGDHLGGELVEKLKKRGFSLAGVGGKKMKEAGMSLFLPMEEFQVMGFTAVFLAFPRLWKNFRKIKKEVLHASPEAVILIDYPDFNMRLASSLKRSGYKGKLIHYVSPSVWAWRAGRVKTLAKHLDLLLTILPFEKDYYAKTKLKIEYVGHPLVKKVSSYSHHHSWREKVGIPLDKKVLGLYPGSRFHEIEANLPLQLAAAKGTDFFVAISCARASLKERIEQLLRESGLQGTIVPSEYSYELMKESTAALATSGTVTLELALHNTPTIVTYRLSSLNYILGRYIFRIKLRLFALPNIILGKEIFPEFVHRKLSTTAIAHSLKKLLENQKEVREECQKVTHSLDTIDSSEKAADAINNLLTQGEKPWKQ